MIKNMVSIIIPTYNRRKMVEEAVECALAQTYKNVEVIIVDNDSSDGTYEFLIKKYRSNNMVKIFKNEKNFGPVKNWEKCLEYTNGEFCKILWSDDLMEPQFVERAVKALQEDVAFVYSKVSLINSDTTRRYGKILYQLESTGKYDKELFIERECAGDPNFPVSPGCALFRTKDVKIVEKVPNNFNIDYLKTGAGPDILIYLFATINYKYIYYIDETLNIFRAHRGSITYSGADLYYSYLTAKLYFVSKVMPNKKNRRLLLENVIIHCMLEGKTCIETYRMIRKCYPKVWFSQFALAYWRKMDDMMK